MGVSSRFKVTTSGGQDLYGQLDLAAGNDVELTQSGNTVTIASTAAVSAANFDNIIIANNCQIVVSLAGNIVNI